MALPGPNHEDCATALRRVTLPSAINDAATTTRSPITSDHIKSPDHMWLGVPKGVAALDGCPLGGRKLTPPRLNGHGRATSKNGRGVRFGRSLDR
jgi:hypothetical protein